MPSRSPFAFQRRCSLRPLHWPSPRTATGEMLIHQYQPPSGKSIDELKTGEGAPPPDRAILNDWTPPSNSED